MKVNKIRLSLPATVQGGKLFIDDVEIFGLEKISILAEPRGLTKIQISICAADIDVDGEIPSPPEDTDHTRG